MTRLSLKSMSPVPVVVIGLRPLVYIISKGCYSILKILMEINAGVQDCNTNPFPRDSHGIYDVTIYVFPCLIHITIFSFFSLKHKPVLVAEDYGRIDGRTAYGSDAQGLSLGLAQWNDRGKVDISAKVWRHTGEKWSRQSEELPLHRVLDLAILACRAQLYFQEEAYRFPRGYDPATRPTAWQPTST